MRTWNPVIPVGVNVLLGVPAVVPIFLTWYLLSNGPLADLGWTMREPTENDGMLGWYVLAGPVIAASVVLWIMINVWMRRRSPLRTSLYWTACAAAVLLPVAALTVVQTWP